LKNMAHRRRGRQGACRLCKPQKWCRSRRPVMRVVTDAWAAACREQGRPPRHRSSSEVAAVFPVTRPRPRAVRHPGSLATSAVCAPGRPELGKKRVAGAREEAGGRRRGRSGRPGEARAADDVVCPQPQPGPAEVRAGTGRRGHRRPSWRRALTAVAVGGGSYVEACFLFYYYLCQELMRRTCV
jgi:hypothetical protein